MALVILLFLGAKRLPEIFGGLGQGIREFKRANRAVSDDLTDALTEKESGLVYEALTHDNRTAEFVYPQ